MMLMEADASLRVMTFLWKHRKKCHQRRRWKEPAISPGLRN